MTTLTEWNDLDLQINKYNILSIVKRLSFMPPKCAKIVVGLGSA